MLADALTDTLLGLVLLGAVFIPLERAFRARRRQRGPGELRVDLLFFVFQSLVMASVLVAVGRFLQTWLGPLAPAAWVSALHALPIAAQVVLVVMAGDVALYWAHRLSHRVPLLWRFHAIHHAAETLDWLSAQREHPLDGIYSHVVLYAPAFLLGVDLDAMMPLFVFRALCANFVHSNVAVPLGPFGLLFGDPVLHRWHHARVERCEHNFANLAPWVDVLFGTHHRPADESFLLGVRGLPRRGFFRSLWEPLVRDAR